MPLMRHVPGHEEAPRPLQEAEAHEVGAERYAEINDPARPFELLRHLVGIKLVDIDGAERPADAGEQRAGKEREQDHRLACRRRELLDEDIDADMDAGAHAERSAELRHPTKK